MAHLVIDLDGTLLDTRARHHLVYAQALIALGGQPMAPDSYWRAKRRGVSWRRILGPGVAIDAFLDRYRARIETADNLMLDRPHPGVIAALRALDARDLTAILITARHDEAALRHQLSALALDRAFTDLVVTGDMPKRLPDRHTSGALRWIGDTEEDIRAARAAEIPVTAVSSGIRTAGILARERPDDIATSFASAVRRLTAGSPRR